MSAGHLRTLSPTSSAYLLNGVTVGTGVHQFKVLQYLRIIFQVFCVDFNVLIVLSVWMKRGVLRHVLSPRGQCVALPLFSMLSKGCMFFWNQYPLWNCYQLPKLLLGSKIHKMSSSCAISLYLCTWYHVMHPMDSVTDKSDLYWTC